MRSRLGIVGTLVAAAAMIAACYDANRVVAPDDVMKVTPSPISIAADGVSTSQITVHVNPSSDKDLKFSFSTSGGTLSIPAATTRGPDANGDIAVFLTSDTTPKTVLVTVDAKRGDTVVASRSASVTFTAAAPSSLLQLTSSSSQIDADGASSVQLRAQANPGLSNRTVTFTTTNGSFSHGATPVTELKDQPTGADGVVIAQLYAPSSPGTAVVTASTGGFSASQTITFSPALPDYMSLQATPLEQSRASEANTISLVARLSRAIGTVTTGTRVDFSATNDANGQPFGRFQNVTRSDSDEQVTAQFVPGTAAPTGLATITARVPGTSVSASVKVNITP